jgi:hypothetical protein
MTLFRKSPSSNLMQWLTAVALTCVAGIASASVLNINGDTTGDPTWNRPLGTITALSGVGTAVPYEVNAFQVNANGTYAFMTSTGFDSLLFIYQTTFLPSAPLTNVIAGSDDFNGTLDGGFTGLALSAGTQYFLVLTGFDNTGDAGAYTASITGAGNNAAFLNNTNPPVLPLPGTAALAALALAALAFARRRA